MPLYVIERTIPGVQAMSDHEVAQVSAQSNALLEQMPHLQWQESFATQDKMYCLYLAPDEDSLAEHARRGGLPADRISEVARRVTPVDGGR